MGRIFRYPKLISVLRKECTTSHARFSGILASPSERVCARPIQAKATSAGWMRWIKFKALLRKPFIERGLEETPFAREAIMIGQIICAPYIFGSNEWPSVAEILQRLNNWEFLTEFGGLVAPRRYGKSLQAAIIVCALCIAVPNTQCGWFANVMRACAQAHSLILTLFEEVYDVPIIHKGAEFVDIRLPSGERSSIRFFPDATDS